MTLKDLKKRVPVADEKKVILRKKELLNTGAEIVVKEIIEDGVEISVYDNGYVLYEEGRHRTVFRLDECKDFLFHNCGPPYCSIFEICYKTVFFGSSNN